MRFFTFSCIFLLLLTISPLAYTQEVKVSLIAGGKKHACMQKSPANLLISLARKKVGSVLVYAKELKALSKNIKRNKSAINALKGKSDTTSNKRRKKLKKSLSNLKLLSKGIIACRDGISSQSIQSDCLNSVNSEGSSCDDLNPCTTNDRCINSNCIGTAIGSDTQLNCSFGDCSKLVVQCANSQFTACLIDVAGSEICNGVDDDCNGQIDEGSTCLNSNPVPTQTPVPTAAPTAVNTVSPVITAGPTPSILTPTSTSTATRTITSSPTRTRTATPTRTKTPTRTATSTPVNCGAASGSNSRGAGCPCSGNNDCCAVCGGSDANPICGGNIKPNAPLICTTSDPSCFNPANTNSRGPGCPCVGNNDCCAVCGGSVDNPICGGNIKPGAPLSCF